MFTRKQQYDAEVKKANYIAKKITYKVPKKPKADELSRFEQDYKRLKTEMMLETNAQKAKDKLNEFVSKHDDHYYINIFRDDFSELSTSIIANASPGQEGVKLKKELGEMYRDIEPKGDKRSERAF